MGGDALTLFLLTGLILLGVFGARALLQRKPPAPPPTIPAAPHVQRPTLPFAMPTAVPAGPSGPPSPEHRAALSAARDQAILLRRDVPPRPASDNRWGGVPHAPRGFTWPFFVTPEGRERALHLLLQLDCSSIPVEGRLGLMPSRGMLYFFLDLDGVHHWKWSVRYEVGDLDEFVPAPVPDSLPRAYAARETWDWPRRDADWPTLLPSWSIEPTLVRGGAAPHLVTADSEGSEELDYWPGTIDLPRRLEEIPGAIVPTLSFQNRYDSDGALERPFARFPHDWQAVRILMGHCARQAARGHLDRHVQRGELSPVEAADRLARLRQAIEDWSARAAAADPWTPLTDAESDAAWQLVLDHQAVTLFALGDAVNNSVDATLAGNPEATSVLPAEALELVRGHHALANRDVDGRVHVHDNTGRMLCAPSFVQGDAGDRVGEWLLLLELAESRPIGHHFAEGVYQFWIRPADLAARRFDLVELTASAY